MATFPQTEGLHFSGEYEMENEIRAFSEVLKGKGLDQSQVRTLSEKAKVLLEQGFSYGKLYSEFNKIVPIAQDNPSLYQQTGLLLDNMLNFKSSPTLEYDSSEAGD